MKSAENREDEVQMALRVMNAVLAGSTQKTKKKKKKRDEKLK